MEKFARPMMETEELSFEVSQPTLGGEFMRRCSQWTGSPWWPPAGFWAPFLEEEALAPAKRLHRTNLVHGLAGSAWNLFT